MVEKQQNKHQLTLKIKTTNTQQRQQAVLQSKPYDIALVYDITDYAPPMTPIKSPWE